MKGWSRGGQGDWTRLPRSVADQSEIDRYVVLGHFFAVEPVEIEVAAQSLEELVDVLQSGSEAEFVLTLSGVPQARLILPARSEDSDAVDFQDTPAFDSRTLEFYAAEAPEYHARSTAGINGELPGFLDLLPDGAIILELGCGAGRDAAYMEGRGFRVEPTDGVAAMAALAATRLGRSVPVMRFDELAEVALYDAIYASYALLHVPRDALGDVLGRIWIALRPGGWHMATYKSGGSEGRDALDRYFNYLSPDQARAYYEAAGSWHLLEFTQGAGPGYDGRISPWVTVIARKEVA